MELIVDIVLLVILLIGAVHGYQLGASRTLASLVIFLLAIVVAVIALYVLPDLIATLGVDSSVLWIQLILFLGVLLLVFILVSALGEGIHKAFRKLKLGALDRILGIFVGIVYYGAILALVLNIALTFGILANLILKSRIGYYLSGIGVPF
jgi:membrane protein required for colicin V production